MAVAVVMPALEMAQETGVLVRWLKGPGESVTKGEPVMEVETDKATVEIEAPGEGFLGGIAAEEGDVVPVGQTIAWILAAGEEPPAAPPEAPVPSRARSSSGSRGAASRGAGVSRGTATSSDTGAVPGSAGEGRTKRSGGDGQARLLPASPKARRLAAERGIDLGSLSGSGPAGAVVTADVLSAPQGGTKGETGPAAAAGGSRETRYETPGSLWSVMAQRMSESWTSVPHFYLVREVDAKRFLEWRERSAAEVEARSHVKLTVTDLLVKSAAAALRNHPRANGAWIDGSIRLNGEVNVGIATALDDGLVVPVVPHADTASLAEIATIRSDLISRARERRLRPEEMREGTFTITNLGMYNVDAFNAVVNPPQAAILAVGRIADRVVPVDGRPEVRPTMIMTLSCDHRVIDGARAARFLDDLAATIANPWRLLI